MTKCMGLLAFSIDNDTNITTAFPTTEAVPTAMTGMKLQYASQELGYTIAYQPNHFIACGIPNLISNSQSSAAILMILQVHLIVMASLINLAKLVIDPSKTEKLAALPRDVVIYDVIEPNGRMQIAQALLKGMIWKQLTDNGFKLVLLIADWIAFLNKRFGGDLEKIRNVANYYLEVWKVLGVPIGSDAIKVVWMKESLGENPEFWERVIDFSQEFTATQLKNVSGQILGIKEKDLSGSDILYPCMHCANTFLVETNSISQSSSSSQSALTQLKQADICIFGQDQDPISDLLTEYLDKKDSKLKDKEKEQEQQIEEERLKKPIILKQHTLLSLEKPEERAMRKNPASIVFVDDKPEDIRKKINKAFFLPDPEKQSGLMDWLEHLILPAMPDNQIKIGENIIRSPQEAFQLILNKTIQINEFKAAISSSIINLLEPINQHFSNPQKQEMIKFHSEIQEILSEKPKKGEQSQKKKEEVKQDGKEKEKQKEGEKSEQKGKQKEKMKGKGNQKEKQQEEKEQGKDNDEQHEKEKEKDKEKEGQK
ncbi:MAG: putative tyrosine-tRNA ligase [Streblomastix strix]|uniref:tyrosine--tRNA ligase n=1 Tax=Streblomastix strix TaxID=222440 RepID=A0A5J4WH47_9EUKA|nr:MAG: putative tyrosine-tRNA ligase [Streblomastix strix]